MTHRSLTNRTKIVTAANRELNQLPQLLAAIQDAQNPSQAGEAHVHGGDRPDPTFGAYTDTRAAEARRDETSLTVATDNLLYTLDKLTALRVKYLHKPLDMKDAQAMTADTDPPGCHSCARLKHGKAKRPWWQPVSRRSDCKGTLTEPVDLCEWCFRYVLAEGHLPSRAILKTRFQGKRVYRRVSKAS